jgi:hypothetical protein
MPRIPVAGFIGQLPVFGQPDDGDRSDFRQVPESDRGNADYSDRGQFGSYSAGEAPFRTPAEVRFSAGYGADAVDLERGFCQPVIREDPAYDKRNYEMRSSQPRQPDEDQGNADSMGQDLEFRSRNQRSRGFLTRPRIPTERG